MDDREISDIVSKIVRARYPEAGFRGAEVRSDLDFDGEPIVRVTAAYERRPAPASALVGLTHDIRDALLSRGDDRFVFLENEIASEKEVDEEVE